MIVLGLIACTPSLCGKLLTRAHSYLPFHLLVMVGIFQTEGY